MQNMPMILYHTEMFISNNEIESNAARDGGKKRQQYERWEEYDGKKMRQY